LVKQSCWNRFNKSRASRTLQHYLDSRFDLTNNFLNIGLRYPRLSKGFNWLSRLRVGAFWTARQLARIGYLDQRYLTECPICGSELPSGESVNHMLLGCPRWNEFRDQFLSDLLGRWDTTNLLGGSSIASELSIDIVKHLWCRCEPQSDGSFHGEFDLQFVDGEVNGNDAFVPVPVCVRVAQYLQCVIPRRVAVLRGMILQAPRADADVNHNGMAVFAEDEVNEEVIATTLLMDSDVDNRRGDVLPIIHEQI
jgi:hypothetical protein